MARAPHPADVGKEYVNATQISIDDMISQMEWTSFDAEPAESSLAGQAGN